MVLDLIVTKTEDGYTAEIPSLKGCESWAHIEDEAINKTLELFKFYVHLELDNKLKIEKARKEGNKIVYKIIFNKLK